MIRIRALLARLLRGDSGQDLVEYALLCAFVALGCVAATGSVSGKIANKFTAIGSTLSSLSPGDAGGAGSSGSSGGSSGSSGGSSASHSGGSSNGGSNKGGSNKGGSHKGSGGSSHGSKGGRRGKG